MDFDRLLDLYEREHAVEAMREWIENPERHTAKTCTDTIKRLIVNPMKDWLDKEVKRLQEHPNYRNGVNYPHIEAAGYFISAAESLRIAIVNPAAWIPADVCLSTLDERWKEFQLHMGYAAIRRAEKFVRTSGERREKRTGALCRVMGQTFLEFVNKHGRKPTALELWRALPVRNVIQEKEKDIIYWRCDSGEESKMTFKTFQNHFSRLNKEYEKK